HYTYILFTGKSRLYLCDISTHVMHLIYAIVFNLRLGSFLFFNGEVKGASLSRFRGDPNISVVQLNNFFTKCQPNALTSIFFGIMKATEHVENFANIIV